MAALPTPHILYSHGFSGKSSPSPTSASTIFPSNMSLLFGDLSSLCCNKSTRTRQRPKAARRSHGLCRSWPLVRAALDPQRIGVTSKESDNRVKVSPSPPPRRLSHYFSTILFFFFFPNCLWFLLGCNWNLVRKMPNLHLKSGCQFSRIEICSSWNRWHLGIE